MTLARCLFLSSLAVGCHSRPRALQTSPTCRDPEVVECLRPLAFEKLSGSDLKNLQAGLRSCFSQDKAALRRQGSCLPLSMGTDARGRGEVKVEYLCSDRCPESGQVVARFTGPKGIDSCCSVGGDPIINWAFEKYWCCGIPGTNGPSKRCEDRKR
jgi:hypothetical protein